MMVSKSFISSFLAVSALVFQALAQSPATTTTAKSSTTKIITTTSTTKSKTTTTSATRTCPTSLPCDSPSPISSQCGPGAPWWSQYGCCAAGSACVSVGISYSVCVATSCGQTSPPTYTGTYSGTYTNTNSTSETSVQTSYTPSITSASRTCIAPTPCDSILPTGWECGASAPIDARYSCCPAGQICATQSSSSSKCVPCIATPTKTSSSTYTPYPTQSAYGQCGGTGYTGPIICTTGYICTPYNQWYSQCLPAGPR